MNLETDNPFSWISELIRALYREGVRHVFISPGSRSTPAVLAAAVHPGLEKHVVLDERSAAFQALGSAKSSGVPALLICTSGTAAANYLPALVEAKHTSTPIIALTADRPPYLRNSGSSQTIDQVKLFGEYAVMFHEIGEPVSDNRDLERLKLLAKQSVLTSVTAGGAVHLNAAFRKPLEPSPESVSTVRSLCVSETKSLSTSDEKTFDIGETKISLSDSLSSLINRSNRPLIIAGSDNPGRTTVKSFKQIAAVTSAPVISEPGAGLPVTPSTIHGYELLFQREEIINRMKPDLILRFGSSPSSGTVNRLLEAYRDVTTIQFLTTSSWQDEFASVDHRIVLPSDNLNTRRLEQKNLNWYREFAELESDAVNRRRTLLDDEQALTDGHVFDHISRTLPSRWDVMLSNSFIIRDYALFSKSDTGGEMDNKKETDRQPLTGNRIITNRGAAGIDGIISTAVGAAKTSGNPMACITGDLAFFHDTNALLSLKSFSSPFVIIVINNGGGTIFKMLPVNSIKDYYKEFFETAQNVDIKSLAEAYKLNYKMISSREQTGLIDFQELAAGSVTLIECRTDSDASMMLRRRLWSGESDPGR